jgi:hypothetical protein
MTAVQKDLISRQRQKIILLNLNIILLILLLFTGIVQTFSLPQSIFISFCAKKWYTLCSLIFCTKESLLFLYKYISIYLKILSSKITQAKSGLI